MNWRVGCALGIGIALSGVPTGARAQAKPGAVPPRFSFAGHACQRDMDCGGSKVCEEGQCVLPFGAQDSDVTPKKKVTAFNSIFAEGLGVGVLYSINYERRLGEEGLFAGRIGFSYISVAANSGTSAPNVTLTTFPITFSYLGIGNASHKLELGAGGMIAYASASSGVAGSFSSTSGAGGAATVLLGYRFQPDTGGLQFRVGFSPLVGSGAVLPWGYLSLGGAF